MVLRWGARGARVLTPGRPPLDVPGVPVQVVDSSGAGDTHTGALLAALGAGEQLGTALATANAAAAFSVTRHGPAQGPTRAELDDLLARSR